MPVHDTTAGFKCYRRIVLETIRFKKIHFVGYAFQIEMKFKTWKFGFQNQGSTRDFYRSPGRTVKNVTIDISQRPYLELSN